ncbi:MAG: hypothetical protein IT304_06735 [Dehalococcoidia bacterium]|nr:hypothetical protein [Dehalococcoidia bacterium]
MTSSENSCSVCGEVLAPDTEAVCMECGRPYHLNQRSDRPGRDCGEVWIDENHLALQFACNSCLHPEPTALLDDVLDAAEAALVVGLTEAALVAAAESGDVRHRRTGSGVYLFVRADLSTLQRGQ